jgi:uncharacterized damage-inducible protein DinB
MKQMIRAVLCMALLAVPMLVHADDMAGVPAGVRGELIMNLRDSGGKVMELAGAIPESKWNWRPAKGVRSVGEVYLHITGGNMMFPPMVGATGGMTFEQGESLDKTPKTKEETIKMLKDSYAFLEKSLMDMSDADMDAQVEFFGHKMSKRAMMIVAVGHTHEHLGQSIAYARMCGVTPPWTARENAAAAKKAEEGKKKM